MNAIYAAAYAIGLIGGALGMASLIITLLQRHCT